VLTSRAFGADATPAGGAADADAAQAEEQKVFSFVQVSDSHIGFSKEINHDVAGTLQIAVDRINALRVRPELLLHTGDVTHLSKPEEFDACAQILQGAKTAAGRTFYVPGEHDVFVDDGKSYLHRFGEGARGSGWQSFDVHGIHFIGLVNVMNLQAGGLGVIGREQLEWLEKDVRDLGSSTPIVVFAHVPLWSVYPKWGWGTSDAEQALTHLKRFGSVTVLNGHIHQVLQKTEGNITFHTACSTAFPQPQPGQADSPGPIKNLPAGKLKRMLGLSSVNYRERDSSLAVVDATLE
jgi:3',5'-cyclic AMP phosphodiesterase CpdA